MKKVFLLVSLFCLPFIALAQFGIKGGVNFGVAEVKDRNFDWENDGLAVGIHAGTFARLNIRSLYLQPELYYTFAKAELRKNDIDTERLDVDFHRLDLPVLVGLKLSKNLRINAGPFASVNLSTRSSESDRDWQKEMDDYYSRTNFGWQAGLGLDIFRFTLDARYETTVGNLREFNFENSPWTAYLPDEQKQRQFVVSLGYKFGK